ncbi:MAG: CPBP family intramembrane glutamic endopeptidase [Saccharofermentanales bacterium]|jgi:membrane protease YdiL (CAAX protease family)
MSKKPRQRKQPPSAKKRIISFPAQTIRSHEDRHETADTPVLTVIDARAERRAQLSSSAVRLMPMAALGIAVYTALIIAFVILERSGLLNTPLGYSAGVEAYALFSILVFGVIPIVTASILIVAFRPPADYVLGMSPDATSYISAPFAGFFIGMFIWCAAQLIATFNVPFIEYLATPAIWENGLFYFGKTSLSAMIVLLVAVLLPAVSIELLARGLIQQALTAGRSKVLASVVTSLLFAFSFFDVNGLVILFLWGIVSFWVRLRTDSLIASVLASASFALSMIFSRSIFTAIGQLLFRMPLIEISKVRVYLLMCGLILIVLMLVPTALINETGRRIDAESTRFHGTRRGRKRKRIEGDEKKDVTGAPARYVLWAIALLCLAALAALTFLM